MSTLIRSAPQATPMVRFAHLGPTPRNDVRIEVTGKLAAVLGYRAPRDLADLRRLRLVTDARIERRSAALW
jgi:hypothetical protein